MSLVEKDKMTELRTAAQSYETSISSEDEVQLKAVAYAINSAANTGQLNTVFQGAIRPAVLEELESKGYNIRDIGTAQQDKQMLISWNNNSN